jgi:hypothetical protein
MRKPILTSSDSNFDQPCLREVMRQQLRLGCSGGGKLIAQNFTRAAVQRLATALQQILISRILNERSAHKRSGRLRSRAACEWKNGTHSHSTVESFYGLGQEQHHKKTFNFDSDHPEIFASEDHGATPIEYVLVGLASCLTGASRSPNIATFNCTRSRRR